MEDLILPSFQQFFKGGEKMGSDFELYVNGNRIEMNDFVASVLSDILIAILSNLRGVELDKITLIEIK